MLYHVKAKPVPREMPKFLELLTNGTIERQEPDGSEIQASMRRAVVKEDTAEWYETCFCTPPLKHERATVYDNFFTDMHIEPTTSSHSLTGESFREQLRTQNRNESVKVNSTVTRASKYAPIRLL